MQYGGAAAWLRARSPIDGGGEPYGAMEVSVAIALALTGLACAVVARAVRERAAEAVLESAERERLHTLFGQHTSPSIVQALLEDSGELERGRRQHVVALFLDVRGFTAFAEQREPEEVVAYLNGLFEIAVDAVTRNGGVVHQLLGDGLLALFGVPEAHPADADRAVDAAFEISAEVAHAVAEASLLPTELGIGLHAGVGLVGLVGPEGHRELKVTGDAVNVAARVEQMNKAYASTLLVTSEVVGRLQNVPNMTDMGEVKIRGRAATVRLYRLL